MGLKDAIDRQREYRRPGPRCTVCTVIDVLPEDERDALVSGLADPLLRSKDLSAALISEGYAVSPAAPPT